MLSKGANPHRKVIQFWFFPDNTIFMPLLVHENATLRNLLPQFNKDELNDGLTITVVENHSAMAGELLSRGADVNYVDKFGMTALALAKRYGNTEIQRVLEQAEVSQ